jgi:hypothetical protein
MHVFDSADRYLGWCAQVGRSNYADVPATQRQWGRNNKREEEIYRDMNIRCQS